MASGVPIVRQIAWLALLPQMALLAIFAIVGGVLARDPIGALVGISMYVGYSLIARVAIARHHRRGMRHVKQRRYADALTAFEESYAFLSRHIWIDRYRSITLLSASAISYREMALLNIAFCHSQLGRGTEAKDYYRRTLAEFPESGMALAAINLIESVEHPA